MTTQTVTWLEIMEPQPIELMKNCLSSALYWPDPYTLFDDKAIYRHKPYIVGQIIDGKRITSIDCKMTKGVTDDEAHDMGYGAYDPPDGYIESLDAFETLWTQNHQSIPFDKAWVWVIRVEVE